MKDTISELKEAVARRDAEIQSLKDELKKVRESGSGSLPDPEYIKRRSTQRGFMAGFMEELSAAETEEDIARAVLSRLRFIIGVQSVGLRIKRGGNFPYFYSEGFSPEFIKLEGDICVRDTGGEVITGEDGQPELACMCGAVIRGINPADSPYFSEGGSFWTNNVSYLEKTVPPEDLPPNMRFHCSHVGYQSVALIPLRAGNEIFGLLQVNDSRRDMFDADMINFLESVAAITAEAFKRKQAELLLQESEERYRSLVENLPIGIYRNTPGPEGHFIAVNPALARMHGFSNSEKIMKTPVSSLYVDPEERKNLSDLLMRQGRVHDYEVRLKKQSGMEYYASVDAHAVKDKSGEVVYFDGIIQDITATKTAMEALRESEQRFRNIIQSSPLGIMIYKLEENGRLVLTDSNPAADRIIGGDLRARWGKTIEEAFPPLADTEVPRRYRRAAEMGIPWYTHQIDYVDEVISGAFEVFAFQTAPNTMAAMFLDVTVRKRQEEEQHKLISILENSREFVGLSNLDGNVIYLNEAGRRMSGLNPGEEKGKQIFDFIVPKEAHVIMEQTIPALMSEGAWSGEGRIRNFSTGDEIEVEITILQLRNPETGRPMCWAAIMNDIRDRLQAEREKEQLQVQLLQSQKMEAIGHLAGGIAHDFNNMLGVILGYSQMMLSDLKPGDPAAESIGPIIEAAKRSRDLTMKMLAFARKEKLNVAPVSVKSLVGDVVSVLERSVSRKIRIEAHAIGDTMVRADRNQVYQAMVNICNNACDAMPGGGTLAISSKVVKTVDRQCTVCAEIFSGEYCRILITDTGEGISPEIINKIFDPFFTTKDVGKGTGLGLSVTVGIIKNHGGHIMVGNMPGGGAAFEVYMPVEMSGKEKRRSASDEKEMESGDETIMVVDDEEYILGMMSKSLSRVGYRVLTASGGEEALSLFRDGKEKIDMVVLDLLMPEMDGSEVYEEIKRIDPGMKVILVSGLNETGDVKKLMQKGAAGFIQKPFTHMELAEAIRKALDG